MSKEFDKEYSDEIIVFNSKDGKIEIALKNLESKIWLSQIDIAKLFGTSKANVSLHINNILKDKELQENSVVKEYLTTASDGKKYKVNIYSLEMILSVGFRVRSPLAVEFRQWALQNLITYLEKGFLINSERLKNPDSYLADYFDEALSQIRDIRASEKRFYQKVRDLFKLSRDYNDDDKATQMFFAETQNKLLFAVTGKVAADLIISRADPSKPNMNLTSWKGKIVRKQDIIIAKNYLSADEIDDLNRVVNMFLDSAELQIKRMKLIDMKFWKENVNRLIEFAGFPLLNNTGKISHKAMESIVTERYNEFDMRRKSLEAKLADLEDIKELEDLEKESK